MLTGLNYGDHFAAYSYIEGLWCSPETNINYISTKKVGRKSISLSIVNKISQHSSAHWDGLEYCKFCWFSKLQVLLNLVSGFSKKVN